jgi:hypothetical protein
MKASLSVLIILLINLTIYGQVNKTALNLPAINSTQNVILTPAGNCQPGVEIVADNQPSALFLSAESRQIKSPDLLFNNGCNSHDYFEPSVSGGGLSLIADLGKDIELASITNDYLANPDKFRSFDNYQGFAGMAAVKLHHTYVVLVNEPTRRGLFAFTVTDYQPHKSAAIKYTVRSYQLVQPFSPLP